MTIVEYRKVKCDECGKEEEVKGGGSYPSSNWLVIEISEWSGSTGQGRLNREVCSDKCALKLMKDLKKIPKRENYIY